MHKRICERPEGNGKTQKQKYTVHSGFTVQEKCIEPEVYKNKKWNNCDE
jgi:hypothetical protein